MWLTALESCTLHPRGFRLHRSPSFSRTIWLKLAPLLVSVFFPFLFPLPPSLNDSHFYIWHTTFTACYYGFYKFGNKEWKKACLSVFFPLPLCCTKYYYTSSTLERLFNRQYRKKKGSCQTRLLVLYVDIYNVSGRKCPSIKEGWFVREGKVAAGWMLWHVSNPKTLTGW